MAPLPSSLVGYRVSPDAIEHYRVQHDLPEYNNRPLLQNLESRVGVPLALVRVEPGDGDAQAATEYYLCCFADYSGKPYDTEALSAIPIPPAFLRLPELIPVEGGVRRLFAPKAMVSSFDREGKSRVKDPPSPIGNGPA
ncbi:hypothetical protein BJ912DRAFT_909955 [Pholiota molesta]|nr:hypothetical protein BJ912DRAFT_909955 [Pholiota molesta]